MDVDLDDAGIGRDVEHADARIARRRIAFDRRPACRMRARGRPRSRRAARRSPRAACSGGMNTCRWPSRTSTRQRRLDHFARLARRALVRRRDAQRRRAGQRVARRERIDRRARAPPPRAARPAATRAAAAGRAASRRATAYRRSRRSGHGLVSQRDARRVLVRRRALQRQHEPGRAIEARPAAAARAARARPGCDEIGLQRIDVDRQRRFRRRAASARPRTR